MSAHSICFGYKLQILIFIFVLLNPDVSFFENTVDSYQLIKKIAEVNIIIQWWMSISNSISIVNNYLIMHCVFLVSTCIAKY